VSHCFVVWYTKGTGFDVEARVKPFQGSAQAFDHLLAARGYRVVVFGEMAEKLRFLWCVFSRVLAPSFVAVDQLYDFVTEVLWASPNEI
jgi:hypothetical protein